MSEFIGARISLISKSNIRYSGTLHDISSEDSTVSLENVTSFGTEDRKTGDEFIAPSEQVYEYIVFRGSDVKDLRIEDAPAPKPMPAAMPNDPAILGARPRPMNNNVPPQFQQGPPQGMQPPGGPGFNPNMPMPPPGAGGWGPNGPGPRNFPYPPPAGWYPPPGPGFPGGPGGPQWNNNYYPPGPPGPLGPPFGPGPVGPGHPQQVGPDVGQPGASQELEPKSLGQPPSAPANKPPASGPGAEKKAAQPAAPPAPAAAPAQASAPAANKGPAPPAPATETAASAPTGNGEDGALMAATAAAKAAVASALSKVNTAPQQAPGARGGANPLDNLSQKLTEMRVNAVQPHHTGSPQYAPRGRGRGGNYGAGQRPPNPVPVPNTAFDFEASNQKFNKEDLVKEVIASGDADTIAPTAPTAPTGSEAEAGSAAAGGDGDAADAPAAYSKTRSFFDNISSEAKDRATASSGQRPGPREWRGEEQRKNFETFGQGSVDGNNYRGHRGRGRGRGRGYNRGRGGNGGYRQNNNYNSGGGNYQANPQ